MDQTLKKGYNMILACIIYILSAFCAFSSNYGIKAAEDSLMVLFTGLNDVGKRDLQLEYNNKIINILEEVLESPQSFYYPFDSLPALGKIMSSDSLVRIFTWNVAVSPSEYKYYGFLQIREKNNDNVSLYFLNHTPVNRKILENDIFNPEQWYGALYYQIHTVFDSDKTIYTLIGFNSNSIFTNIKLIDVLIIDEGIPRFGAPVFQFGDSLRHRAVFEYSSRVVMFLRYIDGVNMIVYDHLSPASPGQAGQYRFYGPDFSYDAFRFEHGKWKNIIDIDWKK
jgi:hypothetical protein